MKRLVTICLLCCSTLVGAQMVTITKNSVLEKVPTQQAFHPRFSADGASLLLTSENYKGLSHYNLKSGLLTTISNEQGAGYQPSFSVKENKVLYVTSSRKNGRLYKTKKQYSMQTAEHKVLSAPSRTVKVEKAMLQEQKFTVSLEDLKIVVYRGTERSVLSPIEGVTNYLWPSLSPDKTKILFTAVTKGTYVCDLSGTVLAKLGKLNAPVWCGNDKVVGMQETDNGESILQSNIVLMDVDGQKSQILSDTNTIALYPAASLDGKHVAYTTAKGALHLLEIETK
ncbi:MAG: hypothetical protein PHY71_07550 [Bacteroidaceae bacterium]|nr:hypothetical protein [Bacteroidaceae bacterium]